MHFFYTVKAENLGNAMAALKLTHCYGSLVNSGSRTIPPGHVCLHVGKEIRSLYEDEVKLLEQFGHIEGKLSVVKTPDGRTVFTPA